MVNHFLPQPFYLISLYIKNSFKTSNMKSKVYRILLLFICFNSLVFAQEQEQKQEDDKYYLIGIETGFDFLNCNPPDKSYIRADINTYSYNYVTSNITALSYKYYAGMKIERKFLKKKLGILSGIRLTQNTGTIGKTTYWSNTSEYFFFRIENNETSSEYLRVKELKEENLFLGVPLEIKIFPYKSKKMNIYYKIGVEFNYLLKSENDVLFYDPLMNERKDDVTHLLEKPDSFTSFLYVAAGIRIKAGKNMINLEGCLPSVNLFPESSGLVSPNYGGGVQLNFQLPL